MQIRFTGHNLEITPAIRDYITKKLHHMQNHLDKITDIHAILTINKLEQKAEIKVLAHGSQIVAHASSENMYESIDKVADRLKRQFVKYKEKLVEHSCC